GAIAYEMLVGDPPHVAGTAQAIIAKLLTEKPGSIRVRRPSVPAHVDAAVGRALEKLPADRFATAKEFADALEGRGAAFTSTSYQASPVAMRASRGSRVREIVAWTLVGALAGWVGWRQLQSRQSTGSPVVRVNFDLPAGERINDVITGTTIAVSPKGDMIAFTSTGVGGLRMYIRRVNELAAREILTMAGRNLTFSPDGRWLAFTEGNVLSKISVDGGQAVTIGTTGGSVPYGLTWSEADTIYVGSFTGMWAIPATGGAAVHMAGVDSSGARSGKRFPLVLPGGKAIAYAIGSSPSAPARLGVLTIGSGEVREFDLLLAMPLGVVDDQLVYVSPAGGLMAVRYDNGAQRPVGDPVQLDEGVLIDPIAGAKASLSPSGTLAYLSGRAQFQPVTVQANSTAPTALIREPGLYSTPRFSPEGGRVAITVFGANATDIWVYDIARNTFTRLTTEGLNLRPEWSPDGRDLIFISTRGGKTGIWRQPADGSGPPSLLYQPEIEPFEAMLSPDTKWLLIRTSPGATYSRDILAVPLTGERKVVPIVSGPYSETMPRFSPDGKWLAYQSNETGRFEIYVRPFPESGARVQVSDNGGAEPLWGRSGRSLYFRGPTGEVMHVGVTTGAEFSIGARSVALTGDYLTDASHASYDIAPDGRFLMLKRAGAESQTVIVHNWRRELRERTRAEARPR
ncbi:MAG: hypothetical protein ABIV11_08135, partial [Gemmatimonadaceae bacterium]